MTPSELREKFWKNDIENGALIKNQYDEIKSVLSTNNLEWVKERYNEIKLHAIKNTEYYKDFHLEDDFPVMTKSSLMENYEACKAKDGYDSPVHISSTSGSTGTPFSVIQNLRKRKRNIADLKVFGELCDYPSHERMIFFRVLSDKLNRTKEQEDLENIYYIDSSDLGKENLHLMYEKILSKKPLIIFSYPTTLLELARYIDTLKIDADVFSMKSVLMAGEGISETDRKFLERVFGCKAYRRYSDMELGILGQDSGDGGSYLLNYGSYYFECLKLDSDEPAENGEVGRIVITDLFNYAFPMIRYDTGDLGVIEVPTDGKFPRLKEIYGRVRDCVYATDGRLISPSKISVMMWGENNIAQWQFIQEAENDYIIKLNVSGDIDENELIIKYMSVLGADANIKVEYVDEIPVLASNKRRAIICNYKK